jgi:hypothetical protein
MTINPNKYIPLGKCKHNYLYLINARHANIGVFNAKSRAFKKLAPGFITKRSKFDRTFLWTEHHWDGALFATAKPIMELEKAPDFPNETEQGENWDWIKTADDELQIIMPDPKDTKLRYLIESEQRFQSHILVLRDKVEKLWQRERMRGTRF